MCFDRKGQLGWVPVKSGGPLKDNHRQKRGRPEQVAPLIVLVGRTGFEPVTN